MYRASLVERQALAVGQDYRLVPVTKRGGIFHPKCTFLAGADDEVLLIGSGNLTFGGHGNNVEVLEVLKPASDPQAFADFGTFIEALISSKDVRVPHDAVLREVAMRLRRYRRSSPKSSARVIHSVVAPIRDHFVRAVSERIPVSALLVLSPYHHPDGAPLRLLAKDLHAKRLIIGVPSGGQPTSFPFHTAATWGIRVEAVQPNVPKVSRPLHAKWWEVRFGRDCITMVGSVNATRESFETRSNIEVAVLRGPSPAEIVLWKSADKPPYVASGVVSGRDESLAVFATLSPDGVLSGCVLGSTEVEGGWRLRIEAIKDLDELVPVQPDGAFKKSVPRLLSTLDSTQLTMRMDRKVARGWLNFDLHLSLSTQQRAVARAIERLLAREDTDDDVEALLGYIASESANGLRDASGSAGKRLLPGHDRGRDDHLSVPTDLLSAESQQGFRTTHHIFQGAAGREVSRLALLLQITIRLLAAPRAGDSAVRALVGRNVAVGANDGDEDAQDVEAQALRGYEALAEFNRAMTKAIEDAHSDGRALGLALCIWLNVNLAMNVHRFRSRTRALRFVATNWLPRVLGLGLDSEARSIIAPSTIALSGYLASDSVGPEGEQLSLSRLRQWINRMPRSTQTLAALVQLGTQWSESHAISTAIGVSRGPIETGLRRILGASTPESVVMQAAAAFDIGTSFTPPKGVLGGHEETLVRDMLRAPRSQPRHAVVKGPCPTGCPKCYLKLDEDAISRLRHFRIGECLGCKSIILWGDGE